MNLSFLFSNVIHKNYILTGHNAIFKTERDWRIIS